MSDLGAIFHVKKDGVQYDAHAYTTLDECPEPNLKLTYKGQQAYVKLEAKGDGDVPCYVKTKAGSVYQVKVEAVPAGTVHVALNGGSLDFTVPTGVNVIKVYEDTLGEFTMYVGVTPGTTHRIRYVQAREDSIVKLRCLTHHSEWNDWYPDDGYPDIIHISWSPEINKQTPDITEY